MNKISYKKLPAAVKNALMLGLGISVALPATVTAAEDEQDSSERIVITGSRIKRVDVEGPSPIVTITKEDMDRQGYATVQDVIDGLSQNTGGSVDQSFTFGFTPAASSVNLRGMGFGRTLTLIDGRRLPIYPTGISGTTNFVNLSSIPTAMIERIEILTDGASAIYGSDAVAGVINVITRKDIEGVSTEMRFGGTKDGGASSQRVNILAGISNSTTQVDFIVDYFKQGALWARDREYAGADNANPRGNFSIGGSTFLGLDANGAWQTIQDPNCGTANDSLGGQGVPDQNIPIVSANDTWCAFNRTAYRQLIAPQQNKSVTARLRHDFDNDVTLNARFGKATNSVNTQLEPNFYGGGAFTGTGTLVPNNGAFLDVNAPNNPSNGTLSGWFVRRLVEYGPRTSDIDDNSVNGLIEFEGIAFNGNIDWEFAYYYAKSEITNKRPNIILSALNAEVENGLDLFQRIPQSVIDATSFDSIRYSTSSNSGVDFSLSGEIPFELGGGAVGFAMHAEHISEQYEDQPDPLTIAGQGFDGASAGGGEREHSGLGLEMRLPFTDQFIATLAARWDNYDDDSSTGSAVSPRLSLEYRPTDFLLVRAGWGESFRAPDMQRLFGATTRGFITLTDPFRATNGSGNSCNPFDPSNPTDPNDPNYCTPLTVQSVNTLTGSNINLEEEEGENWGIGIVWEATEGLTVTADWFNISLENIISTPTSQFILNQCYLTVPDPNDPSTFYTTDSQGNSRPNGTHPLCSNITFDSNNSLQGNAASISAVASNLSLRETKGLDLSLDYKYSTGIGEMGTKLNVTYVDKMVTQFDETSAKVENMSLGALPEYRMNLIQQLNSGDWNTTVRITYIDEVAGAFCAGSSCADSEFIDSYTTVNVNVGYDMGDMGRISFGVNNLFNEEPPEDPTQNNWPWFLNAGGYYDARDMSGYVQYNLSF